MQRTHPCCCWCFRRPSHAHLSRTTGPYSCQENGIPSSCPERAPVWMRSLVSLFLYDDPTDIFSQQMYQVNDGIHPPTGSCCSHSHREQDSTFCSSRSPTSADHASDSCSPTSPMARTCLSHASQSAPAQAPVLLASYSSPSRSPSPHFRPFHS